MPLGQGVSVVDLAYLAGFFDGEGSVMLQSVRFGRAVPSHRLAIVVDNTAEHALLRFACAFGGSVIRIRPSRANQRGHFRWTASDRRAEAVLRALLPHLHVKRDQADVALLFRATVCRRGSCRPPQDVLNRRSELVARIHQLNARGVGAALRCLSVPAVSVS